MRYLNELIQALRVELQEHGEMLARFDDADGHARQDSAEEVLATAARLLAQAEVVELTRRGRHRLQGKLARHLGMPEATDLTEIISLLPRGPQLLVGALADENKELSGRVEQRQLPWRSLQLAVLRLVAARTNPVNDSKGGTAGLPVPISTIGAPRDISGRGLILTKA
jgi:hypothetical protein